MTMIVIAATAVGVALGFVLALVVFAIVTARSWRMVICPKAGKVQLVRCDPRRAAMNVLSGGGQRVAECSCWPERADCDRGCDSQL